MELDPNVTTGDYLSGFLLGTREALYEKGRDTITVTLPTANAKMVGALIALYERAVGFYASLINVNAYHQPGVEAGKKAAAATLALQQKLLEAINGANGAIALAELAAKVGEGDRVPMEGFSLRDR
jgi:glucose-6-phosphate isomerase